VQPADDQPLQSTTATCISNYIICHAAASGFWPLLPPLPLPFHTDWAVAPKHSIAVNNMACSPTLIAHGFTVANTTKAFCKVCGGTSAVAAACLKEKRCVAFVVDDNDLSCGVLKSSAARTEQVKDESKSVFCYTPRAPTCTGSWDLLTCNTAHANMQVFIWLPQEMSIASCR
jgi:hypothetical protein